MSGHVTILEDVHIHASVDDVYPYLSSLPRHQMWLPSVFRQLMADDDRISFDLSLPLRCERARLTVTVDEAPHFIVLEKITDSESVMDERERVLGPLTWTLHSESSKESHVTVEAGYRKANGPIGRLLELLLYRSLRRQAFRDALWSLKVLVEKQDPDSV